MTNESGRLTKNEIDQMIIEAEKFKAEDSQVAAKAQAKEAIEGCCFQMKNLLEIEKL